MIMRRFTMAMLGSLPLSVVACSLACIVLWHAWATAANARSHLEVARNEHAAIMQVAVDYQRLVSEHPVAFIGPEGSGHMDAPTIVTAALQQAALNTASLREAVADAESSIGDGYLRRSFRVTLDAMEPSDLGRFLAAWREREPLWTVARIDLTRTASPTDRTKAYRISLSMTSLANVAQSSGRAALSVSPESAEAETKSR